MSICSLAIDRRGVLVASAHSSGVTLWAHDAGIPLFDVAPSAPAQVVRFAPNPEVGEDGEYEVFAVGYRDGSLRVIHLGAPARSRVEDFSAYGSIMSLAWAGPGHLLFGTSEGAIGQMRGDTISMFPGMPGRSQLSIGPSPDGVQAAFGNADGFVRLVRLADMTVVGGFRPASRTPFVWALDWRGPDQLALATGDAYGVWRLDGSLVWEEEADRGLTRSNAVAFSPDRTRVLGTCGAGAILCDAATGASVAYQPFVHTAEIQAAAFVRDDVVVSGDSAGEIVVWDLAANTTRKLVRTPTGRRGNVPGAPPPAPPRR